MHFRKAAKFRLLLKVALVFAISFVGLELVLLVFNDLIFSRSFYIFDPDMGFRVRPHVLVGHDRANEFGFNDRDYPHERTPGRFRILFISDSFNWMGGRYCNYTALLRKQLQAEFGDRIEVIASGYSQTHTAEQLAMLKKFGLQYNPDLVVLGFFTGNDFFDAHPFRKRIVYGGAVTDIYTNRSLYTTLWGQPVMLKSRLLLFLRERWLEYSQFRRAPAPQNTGESANPPFAQPPPDCEQADAELPVSVAPEQYLQMLHATMQFADPKHAPTFRSFEKYIFDSVREMRDLLARRGIGFVVAAYPDAIQVDLELRKAFLERFGRKETDYDWDRAQRILNQFCREQGIEFHDLLPLFADIESKGARLYRYNNDHWSAAGNELAAHYFHDLLIDRIRHSLEPNR
jgi:lysophospholipase L1-like esterase